MIARAIERACSYIQFRPKKER